MKQLLVIFLLAVGLIMPSLHADQLAEALVQESDNKYSHGSIHLLSELQLDDVRGEAFEDENVDFVDTINGRLFDLALVCASVSLSIYTLAGVITLYDYVG